MMAPAGGAGLASRQGMEPSLVPQMTSARLDHFASAWRDCDLEALRGYLAPDAVYSPLSGELVRGRDAVIRRFAEVLADDEDCEVKYAPAEVSGSIGTCRWHITGRTAEGAAFQIEGIDVYEFAGDLIRSKDVYQKA
jgi:ketosteroid isomerase-like protein